MKSRWRSHYSRTDVRNSRRQTNLRETFPYLLGLLSLHSRTFDRSADMRLLGDNIISDIKFRCEFSSRVNPKRLNPRVIYLQFLK